MSINKLSHLKEGDKIYLELERKMCRGDDADGLNFYSKTTGEIWIDDEDTFYTLNDMKQLANDGIPKQGEIIEGSNELGVWVKEEFIAYYKGKFITVDNNGYYRGWNDCRIPKTELTLAEVEKRLGLDAGSLIIK